MKSLFLGHRQFHNAMCMRGCWVAKRFFLRDFLISQESYVCITVGLQRASSFVTAEYMANSMKHHRFFGVEESHCSICLVTFRDMYSLLMKDKVWWCGSFFGADVLSFFMKLTQIFRDHDLDMRLM